MVAARPSAAAGAGTSFGITDITAKALRQPIAPPASNPRKRPFRGADRRANQAFLASARALKSGARALEKLS
jgi:hypothetical protein